MKRSDVTEQSLTRAADLARKDPAYKGLLLTQMLVATLPTAEEMMCCFYGPVIKLLEEELGESGMESFLVAMKAEEDVMQAEYPGRVPLMGDRTRAFYAAAFFMGSTFLSTPEDNRRRAEETLADYLPGGMKAIDQKSSTKDTKTYEEKGQEV